MKNLRLPVLLLLIALKLCTSFIVGLAARYGDTGSNPYDAEWNDCFWHGFKAFEEPDNCEPVWNYNAKCQVAFRAGCTKAKLLLYCSRGKERALMDEPCGNLTNIDVIASSAYYRCCQACSNGLEAGKREPCLPKTDQLGLTFHECCNHVKHHRTVRATEASRNIESEDISNCTIEHKCEHYCLQREDKSTYCACFRGFILSNDSVSCIDVNECQLNPCKSESGEVCVNFNGSFDCVRNDLADVAPSDIDLSCVNGSCSDKNGSTFESHYPTSDQNHEEMHFADRFGRSQNSNPEVESEGALLGAPQLKTVTNNKTELATCPDGFIYNIRAKKCQDVDECKLGTARCEDENKGCKNQNGTFECYDCPHGFKLGDNGQCSSACSPGYHFNETSKECEDIDECILSPNPCRSNEKCFNTDGGHSCVANKTCEPGHELNIHGYCGDIDECSKGLHNCTFEHSMCQNTFGGFKCSCKEGFRLGAGRDVCEDIDECNDEFSPCMSSKKCFNTIGSFECKGCEAGYKEDETGFCVDINECEEKTHKCGKYSCMNTHGSHECSCDLGGYKFENGTCVDINECEEDTSYGSYTCGLNQACRNTDGSYECYECPKNMEKAVEGCVCKKGFKSINGTCVDIDECSEKENICGHEICYNLEGSYECHSCPSGLRRVEKRCEDINECNERNACAEDELCTNTFADYKCTSLKCEKGYERVGHNSRQCKQTRKTFSKKKPAAISVNTFAVRSNEQIPTEGVQVYTMSVHSKLKCEFRLHLQSVNNHSDKAVSTLSDWKTQEENNSVTLILLRKLEGPQDVELSLDCVYGTRILQRSKIFIFVSKY